ncbi:MAG: FAD-dependent oxidoreductase [Bacteroidetes bacterium]|nr:FAD-dependent oxidoreductase [Bacteroidota bacterium]
MKKNLKSLIENELEYAVAVIGAGPAGLAAAAGATKAGAASVIIIDRNYRPGGILNQCIHDGFGLHRYNESLSGPEYAARENDILQNIEIIEKITLLSGTFVQDLVPENQGFSLVVMSSGSFNVIRAATVVLAMGCRERTAGAISLPGTRPAGIFTAGTAQRLMNIQNISVGKRAVIIGSGDIGLIMARRLTLEGAEVAAVTDIQPYPGGLDRNVRQCLHDFAIPLMLSTGVVKVHGKKRVDGISVAPLDNQNRLIIKSSTYIPCDTILLSVGLIPEHELARNAGTALDESTQGPIVDQNLMTTVPGLFACGNVLQVHDLVDFVSEEAEHAGACAAKMAHSNPQPTTGTKKPGSNIQPITVGSNLRYVLPHTITEPGSITLSMRVTSPEVDFRICVARLEKGADRILLTKTFSRVSPSEMLRFTFNCDKIEPLEVYGESF